MSNNIMPILSNLRSFGGSIALFSVLALSAGSLQAESGQDLFEANCAACHGFDGVAFLPGAPDFSIGERLDKTDVELMKSMKEGLNMMPPWQPEGKEIVLTDEQLKSCLVHIKSFHKK